MSLRAKAKYLDCHRLLIADRVRTESYRRAIFETVKPGDVVLDLGTGTGILSIFACQAGAKKVYAIEAEKETLEIAKRVVTQSGFQDRIVFLNDLSLRVNLPERVDVIVTETTSNFGLEEGVLGFVLDARKRFLKKSGVIIPRSIELVAVPVEVSTVYKQVDFWSNHLFGIDFSPLRTFATNRYYRTSLKRRNFLSRPASLVHIKLSRVKTHLFSSRISFVTQRQGILHGIGGWFSSELSPGIFLSNQPPNQAKTWTNVFFPLERPIPLKKGERLTVRIVSHNGTSWNWRIEQNGTNREDTGFLGSPLSKEELLQNSPGHTPCLSRKGKAELFLMGLINGRKTIRQMEKELCRRYPDLFHNDWSASSFVREVIARCEL